MYERDPLSSSSSRALLHPKLRRNCTFARTLPATGRHTEPSTGGQHDLAAPPPSVRPLLSTPPPAARILRRSPWCRWIWCGGRVAVLGEELNEELWHLTRETWPGVP